jgi:hypothetical protein
MTTPMLLVVLTLNANGLPSAAFVSTDSPGRCEQRRAMLTGLLRGSGMRLIDSRCIGNGLRFSPYRHDAPASQRRFVWLIDLGSRPARLEPMTDVAACEQARREFPGAVCAVTAQRPLGWWQRLRQRWFGG